MDLQTQFRNARNRGVPLVGIVTPDPAATRSWIHLACERDTPMVQWDSARGLLSMNKAGDEQLILIAGVETLAELKNLTMDPVNAIDMIHKMPGRALCLFFNLTAHWHHPEVAQAVWNTRDLFKGDLRTLVILAPDIMPPPVLQRDIVVLEEPMPADRDIEKIARELYDAASFKAPDEATTRRICEASRGMSAFESEQAIAMSLNGQGMDFDLLWQRKARQVENTQGLRFYRGGRTLQDMAGIQQAKAFMDGLMQGPEPVEAFVYVEEIEKALAGASSDHAGDGGVAKDAFQTILTNMEENEWVGLVGVGPPGSGKSMFSQAVGATYGRPTLAFDVGATRNSLVGSSEQAIRSLFRVIKAVGGKRVYWIATCNKYQTLPPELLRRFTDGVWYFGMPDDDELEAAWQLHSRHYQIDTTQDIPRGVRYTFADVRNICRMAHRLRITLKQAAQYIVPVSVSSPQSIRDLEEAANGRFLSASYAGVYRKDRDAVVIAQAPTGRRMQI